MILSRLGNYNEFTNLEQHPLINNDNKERKPKNFRNFYGRLKRKRSSSVATKLLNDQLERLSIPAVNIR